MYLCRAIYILLHLQTYFGSAFRIFIPLSETSTTSINMTGMRIGSTPLTCIFKCLIYCQGEAKFYLIVILAVEGHTQE